MLQEPQAGYGYSDYVLLGKVQAPFTHLHKDGVLGVFTPARVEEIVRMSEQLAA